MTGTVVRPTLADDLATVLNRHSRESRSGTPDFVLAEFLTAALVAFETAMRARCAWNDVAPRRGLLTTSGGPQDGGSLLGAVEVEEDVLGGSWPPREGTSCGCPMAAASRTRRTSDAFSTAAMLVNPR